MSEKAFWDNLADFQQKAHEKCVAIRVVSNPPELCETWNIVFDEDETNCRLVVASEAIPLCDYDTYAPEVIAKYGPIEIVGYTYVAEPYFIGNKRNGSDYEKLAQYMVDVQFSRDEIIRGINEPFDGSAPDPEEMIFARELSALTDAEYADYWRKEKEEALREDLTLVTREEAMAAFGAFFTSALTEKERLAAGIHDLQNKPVIRPGHVT